jgi:hypothetical protein
MPPRRPATPWPRRNTYAARIAKLTVSAVAFALTVSHLPVCAAGMRRRNRMECNGTALDCRDRSLNFLNLLPVKNSMLRSVV